VFYWSPQVLAIFGKIVLIGDGFVGKTTLRDRYLGKKFESDYLPTLGSDFASKNILIKTNVGWKELTLQIWDLAGQPSFKQIRSMYYKHAIGALLMFDVTIEESLYNLEKWLEELSKNAFTPKVAICILGNKVDIRSDESISTDTAKKVIFEDIAPKFKYLDDNIVYLETSAKTGENVDKAFHIIGEKVLKISRKGRK
jgi:small GTP-binding protein